MGLGANGDFFPGGHLKAANTISSAPQSLLQVHLFHRWWKKVSLVMRRWRQKFCGRWKQLCLITPINHAKVWRGKLDKNGIEWIYIKPRDALYRTMWWHTQQNNKHLGGQIYHTRYIVLLYRTCPYIVPYAAISCLVLPNCHQSAAIECKSSHKIVPYAAISYLMKLYFEWSAMLP